MQQSRQRNMSVTEVADALGVSDTVIRDYIAKGCPANPAAPGRSRQNEQRLNLEEVAAWMKETGRTGVQGVHIGNDSPDLQTAKLRKENAMATKYELAIARERKELVGLEPVKLWLVRNMGAARNKLLGLPAKLAPLLEGRDAAERQVIIEQEIRNILDDIASATASMADSLEASN